MNELNSAADIAASLPHLDAIGSLRRYAPRKGAPKDELVQAAKQFEAVLLAKVLEGMKNTIPKSGLLDSPTSNQMNDLFWFYLSKELGEQGGMGLWKDIYRQLAQSSGPEAETPTVEQLT